MGIEALTIVLIVFMLVAALIDVIRQRRQRG